MPEPYKLPGTLMPFLPIAFVGPFLFSFFPAAAKASTNASPVLVGGSLTVTNVVAARDVSDRREKMVVDVGVARCEGEGRKRARR